MKLCNFCFLLHMVKKLQRFLSLCEDCYSSIYRYTDKLPSSDMQFGFKVARSTNRFQWFLKRLLRIMLVTSPMFCTFVDTSEAFDRLHSCKLIKLLYKRAATRRNHEINS